MQKETLKDKQEDLINKIITNSKDAHFAKELISDLLSVKGQIEHQPTMLNLRLEDVADSMEGETFRMQVMKDGTAVYHVKGGMDIVAKPNLFSLNQTISSMIEDSHRYEQMDEDEKKAFDAELQATAYVLNVPMIAFSNIDFMFSTASSVIKFLSETFEEELGKPLQDESPIEDKQFEDATMAVEHMKEELEKEEQDAGEDND